VSEPDPPTRRALRQPVSEASEATAIEPAPDAAPAPVPRMDPVVATIEPASPEVALGGEAFGMPGEHRGGFARELTAPVDVTSLRHDEPEPEEGWTPTGTIPARRRRGSLTAWALGVSVVALAASIFVVWGLPLGLVAVVLAILALRRHGRRPAAIWALVLGSVAVLYGAGWLVWGILRLTGAVA
jgi:hypothetical protein